MMGFWEKSDSSDTVAEEGDDDDDGEKEDRSDDEKTYPQVQALWYQITLQ